MFVGCRVYVTKLPLIQTTFSCSVAYFCVSATSYIAALCQVENPFKLKLDIFGFIGPTQRRVFASTKVGCMKFIILAGTYCEYTLFLPVKGHCFIMIVITRKAIVSGVLENNDSLYCE